MENVKGNAIEVGAIYTADTPDEINENAGTVTEFGILIKFKNGEDVRRAMREGKCEFTVFGESA